MPDPIRVIPFDPFGSQPEGYHLWERVNRQARRHTSRDGRGEHFAKARPNEDDEILEYRKQNDRLLTKEGVDKFLSISSRIIKNANIKTDIDSLNEEVSQWLGGTNFTIGIRSVSMEEFMHQCVYPYSIEDPNGVLFPFPVSITDASVSPLDPPEDGGNPENENVGVEVRLIPYHKIRSVSGVFAYHEGDIPITTDKDETGHYPVYVVADRRLWYKYIPVRNADRESENKVIWEVVPWYVHDTGEVPVSSLLGTVTNLQNTNGIVDKYLESHLHPLFEYGDEFINRFSDHQAVIQRFNHPKVVMGEFPCPACSGKGKVKVYRSSGVPEMEGSEPMRKPCTECGGTGQLQDPGPYHTLVAGRNSGLTGKDKGPLYEVHRPPTDGIKLGHEMGFDIWKMGKQAVGLDVLTNIAESGTAKEMRLEITQDKLGNIVEQWCDLQESFLRHLTALLVEDADIRKKPRVMRPKGLSIKRSEMLLEEAKQAPACSKREMYLQYYEAEFRGDPIRLRIYSLALDYTPAFCMDREDAQFRILSGALDTLDLIKADRVIPVMFQIVADMDDPGEFLNMSRQEVFEAVDAVIAAEAPERVPIVGRGGIDDAP